MSLDIGIKAKREVYIYDSNVTYNLADIYYKCIDGGFNSLNKMTCKKALPIITKAIENMLENKQLRENWNLLKEYLNLREKECGDLDTLIEFKLAFNEVILEMQELEGSAGSEC